MPLLLILLCCRPTPTPSTHPHIDSAADTDTPQDTAATEDTAAPLEACAYTTDGHGPLGDSEIKVDVVVDELATPWGMAWLPSGDMLLTERDGRLSRIDMTTNTQITLTEVPITPSGEGGLLGVAVDPDHPNTQRFYLYVTVDNPGGNGVINRVESWLLQKEGTSAVFEQILIDNIPARQYHNGGRLRIGPDGKLYVGTGDAGEPTASQDLDSLAGKILRINPDGSLPADNPFGTAVWLWGIRNTQGFDWFADGRMAVTDHGPSGLQNEGGRSGHDEVSVAHAGENLGWPDIYACEQGDEQITPAATWAEAMPPGGAAFYTGQAIAEWNGDLLVGVMGFSETTPHLHRLRFSSDGRVEISERYLAEEHGRLRDVIMGPDGHVYVTTSNCDGRGTCDDGDKVLRLHR